MSIRCALPEVKAETKKDPLLLLRRTKQRTLEQTVCVSGIGLFTGEKVSLKMKPAEADSGIVFQRIDLPKKPLLPATLENVQGTPRCTVLGVQGVSVQTVEHLLAALRACQIDNILIEIDGAEVPILDGSSEGFIELIEQAKITALDEERKQVKLETPLYWSQGETHLVALPSSEYRISYTLHYPHSPLIGSQYYSFVMDEESFKQEIAPCRTFSLYEEIQPMIEKGFLKGGSLANAVLIKDNKVANPEGLRFHDEMVRHKILDLIGDMSLISFSFLAHIIAIRSGHASNVAFAKVLANHLKMENS